MEEFASFVVVEHQKAALNVVWLCIRRHQRDSKQRYPVSCCITTQASLVWLDRIVVLLGGDAATGSFLLKKRCSLTVNK